MWLSLRPAELRGRGIPKSVVVQCPDTESVSTSPLSRVGEGAHARRELTRVESAFEPSDRSIVCSHELERHGAGGRRSSVCDRLPSAVEGSGNGRTWCSIGRPGEPFIP